MEGNAGWRSESEYFTSCITTWGELMFHLKSAAEGNRAAHSSLLGIWN
jgi:hypothetical protein